MEPFTFEHSFKFDENLFVQLNSLFIRKNRPIRIGLFFVIGVACLFWKYTLIIGIAIIAITALAPFMEKRIPQTSANTFQIMKYLHNELTYGVSEKKLWVKGKEISVEFAWEHAVVWGERGDWLKITGNHTPTIWFKIAQLKNEATYDNIIQLCEKHAVRCNA